MVLVMDPDTERAVRIFLAKVANQYDLAGAVLYGSRARRDYRPDSDTDIAVLLRGRRGRFLDTKLALADIAYDVLLETGILIQPLPVWEDEWEHPENHLNPALLRNIRREGVRL
jgi:predicted nucleotidyltransferase